MRNADRPADRAAALCLCGRVASWRNGLNDHSAPDQLALLNQSRRAIVRTAAEGLKRHVVAAAHLAGLAVDIFIHSWNPELAETFSEVYRPKASLHEPVHRKLRTVSSLHLSLSRVVAMVPKEIALVMVSRHDLLLYEDVPLPSLLADAHAQPSLWLPQSCQHRFSAVDGVPIAEQPAMFEACGCRPAGVHVAGDGAADCVGLSGKGWLMESPSLARLNIRADAQVPKATLLLEHSLYVLDWWFVATPAVASSFARIHENFSGYTHELRARGASFVRVRSWSHFYWAHHITHVLRESVAVRFMPLLQARDFGLARFVMMSDNF
jgi:hypothetical protein